jgi:hypothetical protein
LPFETLTLGDLSGGLLSDNYPQAVRSAVASHAWKAFVAEGDYVLDAETQLAFQNKVFEPNARIVRLSTSILAANLLDDATFEGSLPRVISRERTVETKQYTLRGRPTLKYASVSWALAIALGRKLRRRRRA